ncbi:hypothetical protein DPMN_154932 [Dreissena polymorpha]|uniref:Uncharacterized protein n=1 Tax=Dreissena polymorpha TaxID=45954 RepID=A0A9D4FPH1_DREPO|nr:hypothetical protein DPMN_154932 [Dreissena polymorpha]
MQIRCALLDEDTVVVATSTAVAGVAAIVLAVVVTYLYRRSRCQMFKVRQPKIAMRTQQAE